MTRYGRDIDWYLGSDCVYQRGAITRTFTNTRNCTFELWHYPSGNTAIHETTLEQRTVEEAWLLREPPLDHDQQKPLAGLRLIISLIETFGSMRGVYGFPKEQLRQIMTHFNLPIQYLEGQAFGYGCYSTYATSQLAGNASNSQLGFIISGPEMSSKDLDIVFTWDAKTNITTGIVRISVPEQRTPQPPTPLTQLPEHTSQLPELKSQLRSLQSLSSHPLAVVFFILEFLSLQAVNSSEVLKGNMVDIQKSTGHIGGLDFEQEENRTPIDLNNLSQKVSEPGQDISYLMHVGKSAQHLCVFLSESIDKVEALETTFGPAKFSDIFSAQTQALRDLARSTSSKLEHYVDNLEHFMRVITIQNQTVYNMIAQRDVQQNIELAKDSKSIAAASKRDSSAMRSIALLTMLVLPGTLTASIFSLPLFNWSAPHWSQVPLHRFWFYWAVTIPLTILILIFWMVWQKMYEQRNERLDAEARSTVKGVRDVVRLKVKGGEDGRDGRDDGAVSGSSSVSMSGWGRDGERRKSGNGDLEARGSLKIEPQLYPPAQGRRSIPSAAIL